MDPIGRRLRTLAAAGFFLAAVMAVSLMLAEFDTHPALRFLVTFGLLSLGLLAARARRAAGVSRDTVYENLRRESIDLKERSAMPTVTTLTRRARVRGHLDQVLTVSPDTEWVLGSPAGPGRPDQPVDHDAARRQLDRIGLLQLLYGPDEVADAYMAWLDAFLTTQAKTAPMLASWSEAAMDLAPIPRWGRDRYGFLCVCCGENFWQVQTRNNSGDRFCKACARGVAEIAVEQLWRPVLPAVHGHVGFPGLLADETRDNKVSVQWNSADGPRSEYVMGDADPFFFVPGWMGMTIDESTFAGDITAPTLTARGRTTQPGHEFEWSAAFSYDPAPETFRQTPYGFRLTSGTLISPAGATTFGDPFQMLDTILAGSANHTE